MSELINPYIAGAPVTEKTMFFGRQDVFEWVQRSLTGKFVDHILVIHGQRRIGKTSVLKQIPFHLPATYVPVFFDLQGRTHTSLDRFLWRLAKEITRTLRTAEDISLPELTREEFSEDPELFQNQLLPQISQAIGDRRLLLIFDEFDSLEEPAAREMLTQDLIPYFSRLMHAPGPLAFIFCIGSSGRKLEHMQASYTDFFRIALYRKISFLGKEEAARLITQPAAGVIEYDPQAVGEIFRITSGHPYFTQLVCHELFGHCQKSGQRHISPQDVEAVLDDVVERGTVNLKFVWDDASDSERYVLTALSLSEDGRDAKSIHKFLQGKKVRISPREVGDSLRHLQEKDVLASDNTFTVDLMRLWLLENKPLERVIEELIEVSPIATRYIEIAEEFRETGNQEEALDSYRRALGVDRQNLAAQVGIASLIYEQGDLSQAAAEYQKALDIDPEDIGARSGFCQTHMALGDQLREKGQIEKALEHYRQVLKINDQHMEAQERLAAHHAQVAGELRAAEKFDEAIEALSKALEFTPEDPAIAERLAEAQAAKRARGMATLRETAEKHFRAEKWEEAIASFEEYLSLEPEEKDAVQAVEARLAEAREQGELAGIYRQAEARLSEKRYAEAVSLLTEIINRDAGYKDATRLLTQAVELQRESRPLWKDIRVLAGAGGAIVLVIIAVLAIRFLPGFSQTPAPIPVATEEPRPLTSTPMAPARTLTHHSAPVRSVAFSPDGATLASGSQDKMVSLWDVESGQYVRQFGGMGIVHSLAFSPDGQTLATGSMESMVKLWQVVDGAQIGDALDGGTENVSSVAFSPDGELLATSGWAEGVQLRRVSDGTLLRSMEGHVDSEPSVTFSPDGQTLAAGDWPGRVLLWDVESGQLLHTWGWHTREVLSVAFSPDGQTLASGSADETVILWDVESGQRLHTLRPHGGEVWSVAFSPDGRVLAAGLQESTVMLWDVQTGEEMGTLEGHTSGVRSVAFSPDGRTLASGSEDTTVMLWDVETVTAGSETASPAPAPVPMGETLQICGDDVCISDPQGESTPLELAGSYGDFWGSPAWAPDGTRFVFSACDLAEPEVPACQGVFVANRHSGDVTALLVPPLSYAGVPSWSPDGDWIAYDDWGDLAIIRPDGTGKSTLGPQETSPQGVAWAPDSQRIAWVAQGGCPIPDASCKVWVVDREGGEARAVFESFEEALSGELIAWSPDGRSLAVSLRHGTFYLIEADCPDKPHGCDESSRSQLDGFPEHWLHSFYPQWAGEAETETARPAATPTLTTPTAAPIARKPTPTPTPLPPTPTPMPLTLHGHTGKVWGVAFSADRTMLASGSKDNTVRLWRVGDGALLHTLEQHEGDVNGLAFSPDGATLASQAVDDPGDVTLWDVQSDQRLRILEHRWGGLSVAFSPDGQTLASAWDGGELSLWRVSDGTLLRNLEKHPGNLWSVAFSPDGQTLASGCDDGNVRLWRVSDGTLLHILEGHTDEVQIVAFSPDGQTLASGSHDNTVMLWDVGSGRRLHTLRGHTETLYALAFSPDGASVASGTGGTVIVWDVQSGQRLRTLEQHMGYYVLGVALAPDGAILVASGSEDGTVLIWGEEP